MASWKTVATVNDSTGALDYNINGTAGDLADGSYISTSNGGTGTDLSTGSGFVKKNTDGTVDLFALPTDGTDNVLTYTSAGVLGWEPITGLELDGAGEYILQDGNATIDNLTVSGELTVTGGSIVMGGEDLTTNSNVIKLNADGTTPQQGDRFGFKIDTGQANDPQFYWDYDSAEFRWSGHANSDEHRISTVSSTATLPGAPVGGDLNVNNSVVKIYFP